MRRRKRQTRAHKKFKYCVIFFGGKRDYGLHTITAKKITRSTTYTVCCALTLQLACALQFKKIGQWAQFLQTRGFDTSSSLHKATNHILYQIGTAKTKGQKVWKHGVAMFGLARVRTMGGGVASSSIAGQKHHQHLSPHQKGKGLSPIIGCKSSTTSLHNRPPIVSSTHSGACPLLGLGCSTIICTCGLLCGCTMGTASCLPGHCCSAPEPILGVLVEDELYTTTSSVSGLLRMALIRPYP